MRRCYDAIAMSKLALFPLLWALALGQADISAVVAKAQALAESGQLTDAQAVIENGLRDFPNNSDLLFGLGMVYLRERNWEKAIHSYKASLNGNPKRVKALFYLGEAYFMNSDFQDACETLAEAINVAPNEATVRQRYGEYLSSRLATRNEGLEQLQKARQLNPTLPRIDFDIGKTQFDLTDFQSAAGSFDTELRKNPGNGEAAFFLAEANTKVGNWQNAREAYNYALTHGYLEGAAYYGLGRTLVELGDFSASLVPLSRALALQPSIYQARFQLGRAYRQLGRADDAQREIKLFNAMSGRVNTVQEARGPELEDAWKHVKPLLAEHKEQQALEWLTKVAAVDPSNPQNPSYLLGEMYFTLERYGDAKRVLMAARNLASDNAHIAAYLGIVQLASGEVDSAEQSLRSALTLDAAEPLALIGMGGIRYRQERWADAVTYLEQSRTADPDTLLLLCDADFRIGKQEDALLTAEVIRAFAADQPAILKALDQLLKRYSSSKPHP